MGAEKPGLLHSDGTIRDLTGLGPDSGGAILSDDGLRRALYDQPSVAPQNAASRRRGFHRNPARREAGPKPPRPLQPGDVAEPGLQGLGQRRQIVIADPQ